LFDTQCHPGVTILPYTTLFRSVLLLCSVLFLPLVLPFLLQDVHVDGWAVARLLLGTMLAPMIAGIVLSAEFPDHADDLARTAGTDRKSTRLNSSKVSNTYSVFC